MAFVVAASIVPAALIALLLVGYDSYARERGILERDSLGTARALVAAVDAKIDGITSALFALATSPALASDDLAAFHRQASAALKDQSFSNVVLIGPDGQQRLNTLRPFGAELPVDSNPELERIFTAGKPVVTNLFTGPVSDRPLVAVGVPVREGETVRYSLNAGIFAERLGAILEEHKPPEGWITTVLDGKGTLVARNRDASRFVGQAGVPELLERLEQAGEGTLEAVNREGTPMVMVYSRSPASGWTVTLGIPKAELMRNTWLSVVRLAIVGFVLLATALALSILIGRRLARG